MKTQSQQPAASPAPDAPRKPAKRDRAPAPSEATADPASAQAPAGAIPPPVVEWVDVEKLKPFDRNPRTHSQDQQERIAAAMVEFGFTNPVLVDREYGIAAGHGRLLAARMVWANGGHIPRCPDGMVPVLKLDTLTPEQRRAYVIADNRLAELSGWDFALLSGEAEFLASAGYDMALAGFKGDELADLLERIAPPRVAGPTDPDEIPEVPAKPVTKAGDIWILGKHRVLCGDCRKASDVAKLLDGQKINVAVTSPPYASQREYDQASGFRPIKPGDYVTWYRAVSTIIKDNLADDGSYFLNIKEHCEDGQRHLYVKDLTIAHVREWGWRFVDELIWHKQGMPGLYGDRLKNEFEPVFHFAGKKCKTRFEAVSFASENVPTGGGGTWAKKQGHGDPILARAKGTARPGNVIFAHNDIAGEGHHSARFPVALPSFFIRAFSDKGDIIFDPFAGSGTTIIAAEQEGRAGYGTEISPQYCDVIVTRWEKFTGQQATDAGGKTFGQIAEERAARAADRAEAAARGSKPRAARPAA